MISEIWEGFRPLPFLSSAKRGVLQRKRGVLRWETGVFIFVCHAPPHPRPGMAPASNQAPAARAARPPGTRPAAPPSRFGAIAPAASFAPVDGGKRKKECAAVAIVRLAPGDSPPGFGRRWPGGCGGWWCAAGPVAGRRGLRRPVAAAPVARGRQPPAQVVGIKGPGLRGSAGRPPCGLWPFPRGGGLFSWPSGRPWGAGSPWPSPARPRLWSMLGGAPQPPGGRVGGVPPVVLFGLVPGRRFALAPPSPRGRKGGRARRPAPLGSICGPGRGGLDSAACGRRGTAGGIIAPGWWIANERHP